MLNVELPPHLQKEFERRADLLYAQGGVTRALIEAVELWLERHQDTLREGERTANDHAYEEMHEELERTHWGKWVVIAHGQLQGIGDTLEEVGSLARDARDRIVMQVGESRPKVVELGWELSFVQPAGL